MTKKWFLAVPVVLVVGYMMGPCPASPVYDKTMPQVPSDAKTLTAYINANEGLHKLKPDNEARLIWANDSVKNKTAYSIVYLHGWSASQAEGDPVHKNIAKEFGCNLYLSRLAEHGIDTSKPMENLTADENWESCKQALAIGKQIGNKVIVIGCSAGGANALQLAAAYPNDVAALVLLSPCIAINNDKAWVLNNHWGVQIAKMVSGHQENLSADSVVPLINQYWYSHYSFKGAAVLQEIMETSMLPETFAKIQQPVLLLYYYKDQVHQDSVVRVDAMLKMFDELGTVASLKRKVDMPSAGHHVIGSYIKSKDVKGVEDQVSLFMKEVLKIDPVH